MIKNLRKKVFSQLHGRESSYIGLSKKFNQEELNGL